MTQEKYPVMMRILHWSMALVILGLIALGWFMTGLEKADPLRSQLYYWHKSFGALILILFFVRVVVRLFSKVPPLPAGIRPVERKLAHAAHYMLYVFILAVPLSGYLMSNAFGHGVTLFMVELPRLVGENKEIGGVTHELHEILPYVMLGLIVLHFLGAMKHRFFDAKENDVLRRML